jgi:hypothetical protein
LTIFKKLSLSNFKKSLKNLVSLQLPLCIFQYRQQI